MQAPTRSSFLLKLLWEYRTNGLGNVWEMANLDPDSTNLDYRVWISTKHGVQHGPRINIVLGKDNYVPMTISSNPIVPGKINPKISAHELNKIRDWILLNKETLTAYWDDAVDTAKTIRNLQKLRE